MLRATWALTPELVMTLYAQPFLSIGTYDALGELAAAGSSDVRWYTNTSHDPLRCTIVDGGNSFGVGEPDYTLASLRSTAVLRWELRPGSILYIVWQQQRGGVAAPIAQPFHTASPGVLTDPGIHTIAIKLPLVLVRLISCDRAPARGSAHHEMRQMRRLDRAGSVLEPCDARRRQRSRRWHGQRLRAQWARSARARVWVWAWGRSTRSPSTTPGRSTWPSSARARRAPPGTSMQSVVSTNPTGGRAAFQMSNFCSAAPGPYDYSAPGGDEVDFYYNTAWLVLVDPMLVDGRPGRTSSSCVEARDVGDRAGRDLGDCWTAVQDVSYTAYLTYCRGVRPRAQLLVGSHRSWLGCSAPRRRTSI